MKKVFNLLFCGALVAALATSCTPNPPDENNGNNGSDTIATTTPTDPVTFSIVVTDITSTTANVAVNPSDNNVLYYYDVLAAEIFDEYTDAQVASILLEDMVEDYEENKAEYEESYGVTDFADAYLSSGADNWDFSGLTASTTYYAFAFAIDTTTMTVSGDLTKESFTTTEVIPSDNVLSFTQDADDKTLITVNATNDDPYVWTYITTEELATYYDGDVTEAWLDYVALLDAYGFLDWLLSYGTETFYTTDNFTEAGEYVLMAAGYNGGQTTEVVTYTLTVTEDMIGAEDESGDDMLVAPKRMKLQNKDTKNVFKPQVQIKK